MENFEDPNATNTGSDFIIAAEPKGTRPGPLIALLLAVVAGGGYMFMKKGPAGAAAGVAAPTNEAQKAVSEFVAAGAQDVLAMEKMLRNTEKVVKEFDAYPAMTQIPLSALRTNPFRVSNTPGEAKPSGPTVDAEATAKKELEEARERATKAVAGLRVETILMGKTGGTAIINGQFVKPGDKVADFQIEAIRAGSVIVRDANFRFELRVGS